MYFLRLKAAYECCLYRKLYGRVTRLNKYSEWERLIFRKTEEESTGENLKKWTEETYQLVKNYTGGEILRGLMVYNIKFIILIRLLKYYSSIVFNSCTCSIFLNLCSCILSWWISSWATPSTFNCSCMVFHEEQLDF